LVSLLHGRYRLSERETVALLADLTGLPLSLGSVPALCETVSTALAPVYAEVQAAVAAQDIANVDETSWKEAGQRCWLWVAVTTVCTRFRLAQQRSAAALQRLLGDDFGGIVDSDRYCAYSSCRWSAASAAGRISSAIGRPFANGMARWASGARRPAG
jgi:transposase